MPRRSLFAAIFLGLVGLLPIRAADPTGVVQPREIRKVYGDGKHNAFTAFAYWKGAYWVAFRHATSHGSGDGDIILLRSTDAKTWTEAKRFDVQGDDRDPQFLVTEKRLILYDMVERGPLLTSYAIYTDDGTTWSKPEQVYEQRYIMWKPMEHEGRFWAAAHKKDDSKKGGVSRDVHLITSPDGLKWEKVSTIRAGNWESETTLLMQDKKAIVFLRQKYGSPPAQILEAEAPYKEWKARPAPINHFSGHSVHTFKGTTYLLTRTMDYGKRKAGQAIYTYEKDGSLKLHCTLPAGGDCAYAEAVASGDDMFVTYYSGHETDNPSDKTNIYLAVVPLKK